MCNPLRFTAGCLPSCFLDEPTTGADTGDDSLDPVCQWLSRSCASLWRATPGVLSSSGHMISGARLNGEADQREVDRSAGVHDVQFLSG